MIISLLLKKALPFALTFVVGTALGGLTWLFGGSGKKAETIVVTRTYEYGSRCRMRGHKLVAESKALVINSKPDARWPRGVMAARHGVNFVRVRVMFGADGRVQNVTPLESWFSLTKDDDLVGVKAVWESAEQAARQIQFEPETINGVPVSVTKDVEIRFIRD
jgi:hypothetical protein